MEGNGGTACDAESQSHIALSFALAVQSILFVLALNAVGPLR
jgi:hypothetical protein